MRPKPATLVHVRWFDSGITDYIATAPEDAAVVMEMESAGLLLREDKRSITLALDRGIDSGNLRCTLRIPKANVRRIRRFRV